MLFPFPVLKSGLSVRTGKFQRTAPHIYEDLSSIIKKLNRQQNSKKKMIYIHNII